MNGNSGARYEVWFPKISVNWLRRLFASIAKYWFQKSLEKNQSRSRSRFKSDMARLRTLTSGRRSTSDTAR